MNSRLFFSFVIFSLSINASICNAEDKSITKIDDVLNLVFENNPDIMINRKELEITEELSPQARAGWLPSLSLESRIYKSKVENSNFGSGDGATTKEISLDLQQPIFRGGRTIAETRRAKSLISAEKENLFQSEQDILLAAVSTYMNVLRDRELSEISLDNQKSLQQELDAARERRKLGDITETDVRQAKTRFSQAESEAILSKRNLETSISSFEEIVGFKPEKKMAYPAKELELPKTLDEALKMSGDKNAELQSAKHQYDASIFETDSIKSRIFPQIFAFASFGREYDPQPGIVDQTETRTIGLRASFSLYEGGATRSRIREAKKEAMKQQIQIEKTRRNVQQKVTERWKAYIAAKNDTISRKSQVEAAKGALYGVREEAKAGERTILHVLDARQEMFDAKAALAIAKRDEIVAKYALASSLGLLMRNKDKVSSDD